MNHFHSSLIERLESRKEMSEWIEVLLSFFEDISTIDSAYGLEVCIQRYLYHSTSYSTASDAPFCCLMNILRYSNLKYLT